MRLRLSVAFVLAAFLAGGPARAQMGPGGPPPSVGVVKAVLKPVKQTNEFIGRVQATGHVEIIARVTAFLEQQFFTDGREVKKGDLLYRLEQAPFQADLQAKQAAVAQANAQLQNATATLNRAQALLTSPAGQRAAYDEALATQRSDAALVLAAQAQLRQSQINLGYTEIRAPIDGKTGRTRITEGNVVGPSSGPLNTIVSQDPMYVSFPVPVPTEIDLRNRFATEAGFDSVVIKLRLPDGSIYGHDGKLNFADNTISQTTDTITLRGVIPNPLQPGLKPDEPGSRVLTDGEFVTVLLQGVEPIQVVAIPRASVLADQQGDFVYVLGAGNKAEQRRIQLGQSTPTTASVLTGLQAGETVIVEGLQRVRPGAPVLPGPASIQVPAEAEASDGTPAAPAATPRPATAGKATGAAGRPAPVDTTASRG